jgi:dTMP kinase
MPPKGIMIVLEGSDGSGKTTQFNLLSERLKAAGYDVAVFDFPRYNQESSHFIKQYLNGRYGPASKVSPYTASLFYALDRYEAAKDIRRELDNGRIVLCNRYVGSNMAHQGSKFEDPVEQRGFFVWEDNLEFQLLNIPRPDINLFLRVPAKISYKLIANKAAREYTANSHDEHEADINHLRKSVATYDLLCQLFPKDFTAVECTKDGRMLGIPEISNLIWEKIKPLLPSDKPHAGRSAVVTLGGQPDKIKASAAAADSDKLVYEFKDASLLLKLQIERQLRSVEPPGFNIWSDANYAFYTPQGLPKELNETYKSSIKRIAQLHRQMRQKLEAYYERSLQGPAAQQSLPNISSLLLPVTPLSALCSFSISLSARSVKRVCSGLMANDSAELQWAAKQLYLAARQKWPDDFSGPLESDTAPEPLNHIIAKLAQDRLPFNSAAAEPINLLEALPRQEFDVLAETIYPYSNLSLDEIAEEVSSWSYQQKYDSLKQAAADPAVMLEKIQYKFDMLTDQASLQAISAQITLNNLASQTPSPRNGYVVRSAFVAAAIDEMYIDCFDESLKLFSILQAADQDDLTVYATLLGHKLRWRLSLNARDMKAILDHRGDETYAKLIDTMHDKIKEVHPLTWEVLANGAPPAPSSPAKPSLKPSKSRPGRKKR